MTVTFDQFLETITKEREPEAGFEHIQGNVHAIFAAVQLWQNDEITNSQMIDLCNFDNTDPELTTVKTYLNGLNKADTLALQSEGILAEIGASVTGLTWNKARLRAQFGLT